MAERQALDRVYRIGQENDVVSYRYIATGLGSIDEVSRSLTPSES